MTALQNKKIAVCGAGALGGNLAETLARAGARHLTVIDHDRVEAHNLATQPYLFDDLGAQKAVVLAHLLYRAAEADVTAITKTLTAANAAKLLWGHDLVLDCFDNHMARKAVYDFGAATGTPVLHAGMADGYAEVLWNDDYRVPSPAAEDVCADPFSRTLVLLAVAVAAEAALAFLADGARPSHTLTLGDLCIRPFAEV